MSDFDRCEVDVEMIRQSLGPGETFLLHRGEGPPHIDDEACWCSPIRWTYDQCVSWPYAAIQERLNRFFCVH